YRGAARPRSKRASSEHRHRRAPGARLAGVRRQLPAVRGARAARARGERRRPPAPARAALLGRGGVERAHRRRARARHGRGRTRSPAARGHRHAGLRGEPPRGAPGEHARALRHTHPRRRGPAPARRGVGLPAHGVRRVLRLLLRLRALPPGGGLGHLPRPAGRALRRRHAGGGAPHPLLHQLGGVPPAPSAVPQEGPLPGAPWPRHLAPGARACEDGAPAARRGGGRRLHHAGPRLDRRGDAQDARRDLPPRERAPARGLRSAPAAAPPRAAARTPGAAHGPARQERRAGGLTPADGRAHRLPGKRARRRGWIVNISSVAGKLGQPDEAAYSASKFAVTGLSEGLSYELAPLGIHVMTVHPALVRTEMFTPEVMARMPRGAERTFLEPAEFSRRVLRALARGRYERTLPGYIGIAY